MPVRLPAGEYTLRLLAPPGLAPAQRQTGRVSLALVSYDGKGSRTLLRDELLEASEERRTNAVIPAVYFFRLRANRLDRAPDVTLRSHR